MDKEHKGKVYCGLCLVAAPFLFFVLLLLLNMPTPFDHCWLGESEVDLGFFVGGCFVATTGFISMLVGIYGTKTDEELKKELDKQVSSLIATHEHHTEHKSSENVEKKPRRQRKC